MNEIGWTYWNDLRDMLNVVRDADPRRKRLLVCAYLRHVWPLLDDPRSRAAVEAAEGFADHRVSRERLKVARQDAVAAVEAARERVIRGLIDAPGWPVGVTDPNHPLVRDRVNRTPVLVAAVGAEAVTRTKDFATAHPWDLVAGLGATLAQSSVFHFLPVSRFACDLTRDIFGNPFRDIVLDPTWRTATVAGLADAIDADQAFDRLLILADALEDAGCTDPAILAHCRGPGPHVRGCWVVDLVLGKS